MSSVAIIMLLFVAMALPSGSFGEVDLGPAFQCAHDFKGNFIIKNDREILIKGFSYDGKGPAAWFHGQLKGSKGIYTSDNDKFVTLPYPKGSCDRLKKGKKYKNQDITLILPIGVRNFTTIGILCYEFCHSFGHIVIPDDISVPEAPADLLVTSKCPKPKYKSCLSTQTKHGEFKPECAGASRLIPNAIIAVMIGIIFNCSLY